jgi:cbb3-type cytochrome oxidase subunit 3
LSPELGQAWFRIAFFITAVSGVLILFQIPGSAEFVISVTSFVIGLIFLGVVTIVVRRSQR